MGKEEEKKKEIETLNSQIDDLNVQKTEYQRVNRELNGAIDDFEDMKKSISKAQGYLKEGDTGEETMKQIAEMDEDIKNVNEVIGSLEEVKKETSNEIRKIDEKIIEKNNQIKKLNKEVEEVRRENEREERKENKNNLN